VAKQDVTLHRIIERPIPLAYNPVQRFYRGGKLVQRFRGLPEPRETDRPEDWVGSCTLASNRDAEGREQGLSEVALPGVGRTTLQQLVESYPEEMLGAAFLARWGATTGLLVKLLSADQRLPVHAHPSRSFAEQHLGSRFGKTEAWIVLEAEGKGGEPPYVGLGFCQHVTPRWFRETVLRQDTEMLVDAIHRFEVKPGDVFLVSAGLPHFIGPGVLVAETQEPTDFGVLAEWQPFLAREEDARMGLDWDTALAMFDYTPRDWTITAGKTRQQPRLLRERGDTREWRLLGPAAAPYFGATRLDVADELAVEDGRFYVGIVTAGEGSIEGDFGQEPVKAGDTFACAAALGHRFRAGQAPLRVIRCLGPSLE